MYLKGGEELTLETLLYGLMLCSGNDAAVAIAEHVGGSEAGFAELMNETAAELGMEHTSYYNVFTVEGTAASRVFFRIVA